MEKCLKRIYLYGGCSESPFVTDLPNMFMFANELRLLLKGVEIFIVSYHGSEFSPVTRTVYNVDAKIVIDHEIVFNTSTAVIAHSYGCLIAKNDIYNQNYLESQVYCFIQMAPFSIQAYLESGREISPEEMNEWDYRTYLQLYTIPTYRPDTHVVYGEFEHKYNIDGIGFLNLNKEQLHRIPGAYHGMNLSKPDSTVFQHVLQTIYKLLNHQ